MPPLGDNLSPATRLARLPDRDPDQVEPVGNFFRRHLPAAAETRTPIELRADRLEAFHALHRELKRRWQALAELVDNMAVEAEIAARIERGEHELLQMHAMLGCQLHHATTALGVAARFWAEQP